jgi:5-oxoprolinase (ATP-hydrolysing)
MDGDEHVPAGHLADPGPEERTARYLLGFDIGGTFTDVLLLDKATGEIHVAKVLTTPADPSVGALAGIRSLLAALEIAFDDITLAVHGTTLVTNAIIERRGAKIAMLTTDGHRDVLEISTGMRYDMYNFFLTFPTPLVPRRLRLGIEERVRYDGTVLTPLEPRSMESAIEFCVAQGVEAIAVCFLHSYANASHEIAVAEYLNHRYPRVAYTLSSEMAGEPGEIDRFSTTVANAYVQPLMRSYLRKLSGAFVGQSVTGDGCSREAAVRLCLMTSSGGTASVAAAEQQPIQLVESGPAAGALAAAFYGQLTMNGRVLSFDMGGTTAKACLIEGGRPAMAQETEVAREERFQSGSGIPLKVPVVDLIEIGAGGGSIAHVDSLGLLKVGPQSAGSEPGPACYGRGGSDATVTDANLVLGYLDADYFLGGEMQLDRSASESAIVSQVGSRLNIGVIEAAWGIHDIVNENMASAARVHISERNRDPRQFTLVAFGGAGPGHACEVARKVRIPRVLVPLAAGATSALGLLVAPPSFEFSHAYTATLGEVDWQMVNAAYESLKKRAYVRLAQLGVRPADVGFELSADMRYVGQIHQISVPLTADTLSSTALHDIRAAFLEEYARRYTASSSARDVEALVWRLRALGPKKDISLRHSSGSPSIEPAKRPRPVYLPLISEFVNCNVYDHYNLTPGTHFGGPAIIEQRESTTVIGPRDTVQVDDYQNLIIELG